MSDTVDCVWLHGVVRRADLGPLTTLTGMDGRPPAAIDAGALAAVVTEVPLDRYGEEALHRALEDLSWLEGVARAHHGVVDALARSGPVVPARLATVYRDREGVARMVAERRAEFDAALARVEGRVEIGVKAYVMPHATGAPADPGPAGPGVAYLRRRRAQLTSRDEAQAAAARAAVAVHAALSERVAATRRHPPQDRRVSGEDADMVLNGAYLVPVSEVDSFTATVATLAGRHPAVRLSVTGPWPPYSFASHRPEAGQDPGPAEEAGR